MWLPSAELGGDAHVPAQDDLWRSCDRPELRGAGSSGLGTVRDAESADALGHAEQLRSLSQTVQRKSLHSFPIYATKPFNSVMFRKLCLSAATLIGKSLFFAFDGTLPIS